MCVEALFKIAFPFKIVWICLPLDFPVPNNRHLRGFEQMGGVLIVYGSVEHPVVISHGCEVLLRNPCVRLARVFSPYPSSHCMIDLFVYLVESFFAYHMPMIVGPSSITTSLVCGTMKHEHE